VSETATYSGRLSLQTAGDLCVASGVLGVVAGVLTLVYPKEVDKDVWSYPFGFKVGVAMGVVLAIVHLMTLAGVRGLQLTRRGRGGAAERLGLAVVLAGFLMLTVCEVIGGLIGRSDIEDTGVLVVGSAFGVASLLVAGGSIAAAVVMRRGRRSEAARWLLASAIVMIVVVTPANVSGDLVLRMVALMLWSSCFVPLGLAVRMLT
jgi:hypothetical protein